jgi:hypothetical protein
LRWVIDEMEKRYKIFAKAGVRNITGFNARPTKKTQKELDAEAGASPSDGGDAVRHRRHDTDQSPARGGNSSSLITCPTSSSSLTSWLT